MSLAINGQIEKSENLDILDDDISEPEVDNKKEQTVDNTHADDIDVIINPDGNDNIDFYENEVEETTVEEPKVVEGCNLKVLYSKVVDARVNQYKSIDYNQIDEYPFDKKGFVEYIIPQKYVHLYFDFDSLSTEEEYLDVITWLDRLKVVFKEYSIGGYSNNKDFAEKYGYRYIEGDNHFVSIHVVYYQTAISTDDIIDIASKTKKKELKYNIPKCIDNSVYKLAKKSDKSRQMFRHVLSDKNFRYNKDSSKQNHGVILNGLKPQTQIVQVKGGEEIVSKTQWNTVITEVEIPVVEKQTKKSVTRKDVDNIVDAEEDFDDENIEEKAFISKELFDAIVGGFDNLDIHNYTDKPLTEELSIFPIITGIFACKCANVTDEMINDTLEYIYNYNNLSINAKNNWYKQVEALKDKPAKNIYGLYKMLKTFNLEYYNKEIKPLISKTYEIDIRDPFNILDMMDNAQSGKYLRKVVIKAKNENEEDHTAYVPFERRILNDLQRVMCVVQISEPIFVVKDYDSQNKCFKFSYLSLSKASLYFGQINITQNHTVWSVYSKDNNKNRFKKLGMKFYSTNKNMFSFFQGYDYDILNTFNMDIIQLYLDHIKNVICSGDEILYEYILNWYANIVQKPGAKNGTAIVLFGKPGGGKNIFTNTLCKLMKRYSNRNVTNVEEIVGKFNTGLENKKLVVLNELSSAENTKFNFDIMKSVITEKSINVNAKNENIRVVDNVANVIILSNHVMPIKIETSDRRYVIINVSDCKVGDFEYFSNLIMSFKRESFYDNLLTFFMQRDISTFNPRLIPMTEAKENLLEASKDKYQLFYEENKEEFDKGYNCALAYYGYCNYCTTNGYQKCSNTTFGLNIKQLCDRKQIRKDGERVCVYMSKGCE